MHTSVMILVPYVVGSTLTPVCVLFRYKTSFYGVLRSKKHPWLGHHNCVSCAPSVTPDNV